jgi:ABC-type antimicrobial peptide transport system permease subunit
VSWADALALALANVGRRFGRAVLTVLAVGLAAALLTALLTIATTAETRVLSELAKGGPLAGIKVSAAAPDPGEVDNDNARPGPPRDLDDEAVRRIAALPDVVSVVPVITSRILVVPPIQPVRGETGPESAPPAAAGPQPDVEPFVETLVGVDVTRADRLPITLLAGRLPVRGSLTEVAVTQGYLDRLDLDPKDPAVVVGTEIELGAPRFFSSLGEEDNVRGRWVRTLVVGVVAQEAAPGMILAPSQQARLAQEWAAAGGGVGVPGPFTVSTSPYGGLFVVADGLDRVGKVRTQITAIGYSTSAPENLIASVQRYLRVVEIVLTAIGAIALVIASLGIASALLAAIRERRREIGVLKAIGARDRDVRRVFLIEASLLGFIGGVLGTMTGWGIARLVGSVVNGYLTDQGLAGVHLGLSVPILAGGIAGSTLLALVAGALPARRAARLPAREAIGGL